MSASYRGPEDLIPLDLLKTLSGAQPALDGKPFSSVAKKREVETTEARHHHPRAPGDELIVGPSAWRAVPRAEVERLPTPFGKDGDGPVERPRIFPA